MIPIFSLAVFPTGNPSHSNLNKSHVYDSRVHFIVYVDRVNAKPLCILKSYHHVHATSPTVIISTSKFRGIVERRHKHNQGIRKTSVFAQSLYIYVTIMHIATDYTL